MLRLMVGFFLFILLMKVAETTFTLAEVEQGWLRGEIKTTSTKLKEYHSFKGIPYAAPPLGPLRFKAPQQPLKWKGIRNATEHCSICTQPATYLNITAVGGEDCLCLNVYTPNMRPRRPLPVMLFIHGGVFILGSGNSDQFAPDFLMPYDVLLVTVNYRLGALGFISLGTEDVPGNAGLKDIIAALTWVQKNIGCFGGDPDRVTAVGQSAGASIISLLIMSPSAEHLFKRAILMSGSFYNDWVREFEPRRRAFAQGRVLGLDTKDPNELINFLQRVPAKDLVESHPNFLTSDEISSILHHTTYYPPVVEKKFGNGTGQVITTSPSESMCRGDIRPVDIMMGYTASEGSGTVEYTEEEFLKYYSQFKELLVPLKIRLYRSPKEVLKLADRVERFYFKNQPISRKTILALIKFYSYIIFVFDIQAYIERFPRLEHVHRYIYRFDLYSSRNYYAKPAEKYGIKEATHMDDLVYIFDGSLYNQVINVNSKVFQYIQLMCKIYTNFVKYGNPTPDKSLGLIWPEYDPNRRRLIIARNGNLTVETDPRNDPNLNFWRELYRSTGINVY